MSIKQFPTDNMVDEYFTNTIQGAKFRMFRDIILNMKDGYMIYYQLSTGVCCRKDKNSDSGGVDKIHRSQSFG